MVADQRWQVSGKGRFLGSILSLEQAILPQIFPYVRPVARLFQGRRPVPVKAYIQHNQTLQCFFHRQHNCFREEGWH